jgi:hypothetical protein
MRFITFLILLAAATSNTSYSSELRTASHKQERAVTIAEQYGKLPMSFEPNRGQFASQFAFASRGTGYAAFMNASGVTLKLGQDQSEVTTLSLSLRGANRDAAVHGENRLPGEANYFHGTREHWITNIPMYEKVTVERVYPGVDVTYYGNQGHFEYDFIIKPGATPQVIDVAFEGAAQIKIDNNGDLIISTTREQLRQPKPVAYQDAYGKRIPVDVRYVCCRKKTASVSESVRTIVPRL